MYQPKRNGSGVEVYQQKYTEDFLSELSKPHLLKQAVANNELEIHY